MEYEELIRLRGLQAEAREREGEKRGRRFSRRKKKRSWRKRNGNSKRVGFHSKPTDPMIVIDVGMTIEMTQELQALYDSGARFSGYQYTTVVDLTKEKLTDGVQGTIIRENDSGKYLAQRMRIRYNLAPDAPIFKIQPISSLRALYTRNGNNYTLLEVLTHNKYDSLMKRT